MFKMRDILGKGFHPPTPEDQNLLNDFGGQQVPPVPFEQAPMNEANPMELEPDFDTDDNTFGGSLGRENEMNGRPKAYPRKLF